MTIIFICIIEGKESNSEFNFFDGLNHITSENLEIKPISFAKASRTSPTERNKQKWEIYAMNQISEDDIVMVFYIADGEKRAESSFPSIKKTSGNIQKLFNKLNQIKNFQLEQEKLVIYDDKGFEDILGVDYKNSKFSKHEHNDEYFYNFCEEKSIDLEIYENNRYMAIIELKNFFENTELEKIFNLIHDLEFNESL